MDVHSIPPASLHTYKIPSDLEISLGMKQCMHFICIRTSCVATQKETQHKGVRIWGTTATRLLLGAMAHHSVRTSYCHDNKGKCQGVHMYMHIGEREVAEQITVIGPARLICGSPHFYCLLFSISSLPWVLSQPSPSYLTAHPSSQLTLPLSPHSLHPYPSIHTYL